MEPETTTNLQPIIIALTPVIIAAVKMLIPKIPKAALPIVAPLLGAAADIAGHYAGLWQSNGAVGAVLGMAGVGLREAYDQGKKVITPAKVGPPLLIGLCIIGLGVGCARFRTIQKDISYDEQGNKAREVVTKASAVTFFDADSQLANWKASQDEGQQGAEVGTLNQSTSGTNIVQALGHIQAIVEQLK